MIIYIILRKLRNEKNDYGLLKIKVCICRIGKYVLYYVQLKYKLYFK